MASRHTLLLLNVGGDLPVDEADHKASAIALMVTTDRRLLRQTFAPGRW